MADMTAVLAALKQVEQMISEADGRDMVGKRTPPDGDAQETQDAYDSMIDDAKRGSKADNFAQDNSSSEERAPLTPEKRKKLVGF